MTAAALMAGAMAFGSSDPVGADSNPPNTAVFGDNDFYAYLDPGENLDVLFTKVRSSASDGAVVTVEGPGVAAQTCTFPSPETMGTTCGFSDLTAPSAGVWRVRLDHGGTTGYSWQIDVQDGTSTIPGRVWTENLGLVQPGVLSATTDIPLWYQSEFGFLYETTTHDTHGINSRYQADVSGNRIAGGCLSAYESFGRGDNRFEAPAIGECGSVFKIFFAPPAAELPETAPTWDGGSVWIKPPVVAPEVASLTFTPDSPTVRSGEIAVTTANFSGDLAVLVDTNDDSVFDGPEDVRLPVFSDGSATLHFDGNDGQGNPIPMSQTVRFRAWITRAGEIHFVSSDMEIRRGLQVTRTNGPGAPDSTLYWDDSGFPEPDPNRCGTHPTPIEAQAGVDSSGGVHGWDSAGCTDAFGNVNNGVNGSWGDQRFIDDWTFASADVRREITVPGQTADLSVTKSVDNMTPPVGGVVTFMVTLSNAGPDAATNVVVSDAMPSSLSFASATPSQGTYSSASGEWTVGTLASGATATLYLTATVTDATVATNTAQVSATDQADPDSAPANDASEDDQASVTIYPIPLVPPTSPEPQPEPQPQPQLEPQPEPLPVPTTAPSGCCVAYCCTSAF